MENYRIAIKSYCLALLITALLSVSNSAFAYDQTETHPALTNTAATIYNSQHNYTLSAKDIDALKQGSIHEDVPFRFLNHFYDPINNIGLWGTNDSSKKWAQSPYDQIRAITDPARYLAKPMAVPDNQTWQKALYSYAKGDRQAAMYALGHVLHLIEDATVPEHVRNDAHAGIPGGGPKSALEDWAKGDHLTQAVRNTVGSAPRFSSLAEAFDKTALYTNQNFYSSRTVGLQSYSRPEAIYKDGSDPLMPNYVFIYGVESGTEYHLAAKNTLSSWDNSKSAIGYTLDNKLVMQDYWSRLSKKAILNDVGVIDLFFREAEELKEKADKDPKVLADMNLSWLERQRATVSDFIADAIDSLGLKTSPSASPVPSAAPLALSPTQIASPTSSPRISPVQTPVYSPSIAPSSTPAPNTEPDGSGTSSTNTPSGAITYLSGKSPRLASSPSPTSSPTPNAEEPSPSPSQTPPPEEPTPPEMPTEPPTPTPILGCTDPAAENYDPTATQDDGTCVFEQTPPPNAPVIAATVDPVPNAAGWNNSDVTVTWDVSGEDISSETGCDETTVSEETDASGLTLTCEATNPGGTTSSSVTVKLDKTPPQITLNSPVDGAEYELDQSVLADWSATDALSGIDSTDATVPSGSPIYTAPEGTKEFNISTMDAAGNAATTTISYNVVQPPPTINFQRSNDEYFDNVAWYFDEDDVLTIEFDWLKVDTVPGYPDTEHRIQAAWNTDLVSTLYTYPRWQPYWKSQTTGALENINTASNAIAVKKPAWSDFTLPHHVVARVDRLIFESELLKMPQYITKQDLDGILGRPVGTGDFVTLAYGHNYGSPMHERNSNTHFFGSGLQESSTPPNPPQVQPIQPLTNFRWGKDATSSSGYSLSFNYSNYPFIENNKEYLVTAFFFNAEPPHHFTDDALGGDIAANPRNTTPQGTTPQAMGPVKLRYPSVGSWWDPTTITFPNTDPALPQGTCGSAYVYPKCDLYKWSALPHVANATSSAPWHISVPITGSPTNKPMLETFTSSDYITIGYYIYRYNDGGLFSRDLSLLGIDTTKYYFEP